MVYNQNENNNNVDVWTQCGWPALLSRIRIQMNSFQKLLHVCILLIFFWFNCLTFQRFQWCFVSLFTISWVALTEIAIITIKHVQPNGNYIQYCYAIALKSGSLLIMSVTHVQKHFLRRLSACSHWNCGCVCVCVVAVVCMRVCILGPIKSFTRAMWCVYKTDRFTLTTSMGEQKRKRTQTRRDSNAMGLFIFNHI